MVPFCKKGPHVLRALILVVQLEDGHERLGGHLDRSQLAHLLLAFLLLLEELLLSRDIAAVALGKHVLAERFYRFAGDDLGADGGLNRDLKELAGDVVLKLFADTSCAGVGSVGMHDKGKRIDNVAVQKDVELAQKVINKDDVVDDYFSKVKCGIITLIAENHADGEFALDLLMIAKYFERIGDHATNIAEWVIYSVTGTHKEV